MRFVFAALGIGIWLAGSLQAAAADPPEGEEKGKPPVTVEVGIQERVRSENWDEIMDWDGGRNDERRQWRFRTRVWAKANVLDRLEVNFGLNNESRKVTARPSQGFVMDEVIVETAYLDFRFTEGWSIRAGRQNIMRGEGFIIFDGNALDGSRTAYFNAVNLSWAGGGQRKLELLAISNPYRDRYGFRINDKRKPLTEWDEQAVGVYYTDRGWLAKTQVEGYYFYKKEWNDYRPVSHPQHQPERRLHTLGGRVVRQLGQGWSATGELAGQWGRQHPDVDIRALGGYAYVRKQLGGEWKPAVSVGYWGMSGDDPSTTGRHEGWNPLFSRWPKWSELYIYSQVPEVGPAYWTNVGMWQAEVTFQPHRRLKGRATYYRMGAFHPFAGNPLTFGSGKKRGDLFQGRLDFELTERWTGHFLYEGMAPGSFHTGRAKGYFARFEIIYTFKEVFKIHF